VMSGSDTGGLAGFEGSEASTTDKELVSTVPA
jgi:hypothetical protein